MPHLDAYRELRALTFRSDRGIDAAIDLLWSEELAGVPHALAGGDTLIIPAEAVPFFKARGLKFRNTRVLSASELPAEDINRLRREQGPF